MRSRPVTGFAGWAGFLGCGCAASSASFASLGKIDADLSSFKRAVLQLVVNRVRFRGGDFKKGMDPFEVNPANLLSADTGVVAHKAEKISAGEVVDRSKVDEHPGEAVVRRIFIFPFAFPRSPGGFFVGRVQVGSVQVVL